MVTRAASQPAALTQRQVDDFARGNHEEAPRLLRQMSVAAPDESEHSAASSPVEIAAKDMQGILRSGAVPSRVLRRIAVSTPAPAARPKGKLKAAARKAYTAPKLKPPAGR
jgi:hypothetical protein